MSPTGNSWNLPGKESGSPGALATRPANLALERRKPLPQEAALPVQHGSLSCIKSSAAKNAFSYALGRSENPRGGARGSTEEPDGSRKRVCGARSKRRDGERRLPQRHTGGLRPQNRPRLFDPLLKVARQALLAKGTALGMGGTSARNGSAAWKPIHPLPALLVPSRQSRAVSGIRGYRRFTRDWISGGKRLPQEVRRGCNKTGRGDARCRAGS